MKKNTTPQKNLPISIRELRVQYQSGEMPGYRPQIKLTGNWLSEAGFTYGDEIIVIIENNRLIIEKVVK